MLNSQVKHDLPDYPQIGWVSDIASRIRQRRNELQLTQPQVAKRCGGISKSAVSQWENGDTEPTGINLTLLATALKTTERWIAFGRGPKEPNPAHNSAVPVISFVQAGEWTESANPYPPGFGERYLVPSRDIGPRAFALTIQGKSMEPDFHEGDDIIVDPDVQPRTGDFVVAKRAQDDEATFKRLYRREAVVELRPLNQGYDVLRLDRSDPGRIIAVMVEHRRYRR